MTTCKCYHYEPDADTRRADIMTVGDGEGWTVTQDCEIHANGKNPSDFIQYKGKTYRVQWVSSDGKYLSAEEV